MAWMNQWEIEEAKQQCARHPILRKATQVLYDLMTLTNEVSDGWHYWPKPSRAASRLQELIQRGIERRFDDRLPDVTETELKRALTPIKSLMTRHAKDFGGRTLTFPC